MTRAKGERKPSNPVAAGISGAIYGGACGALIGASISGTVGAWVGALIGGLYFGFMEAITDVRRKPGELKPFWHRLIGTTMLGAAQGVILGAIFDKILVVSLITGVLAGLTGLGLSKLAPGSAVGLVVGIVALVMDPGLNAAIVGGAVVLIYRLLLVLFFKESAPIQFAAEHVSPADARYVVPFEARTKHIGAAYVETLARESDGSFKRNRPGIGIVETMGALRGPSFEPDLVDPLIREFYEHTSRFKLSIVPR